MLKQVQNDNLDIDRFVWKVILNLFQDLRNRN